MNTSSEIFGRLTAHLWRGGSVANWFTSTPQANGKEAKRTIWFEADHPTPYPTGKTNVWFGLAPLRQIPPTNADGEPTPTQYVRSQLAYLAAINCMYAEFDKKDYADGAAAHIYALPLQPSVLIESSPGSYHAYWLLADTFRLDTDAELVRAKAAQAGWVNAVGGDKGAKDLTRVLRIPGTLNVKAKYAPNYPTVNVVYAHFDRLYTFEELEAVALPALTVAEQTRAARGRNGQPAHVVAFDNPGELPDLSDLPPDLAAMLDDPGEVGGRSERDYRVCSWLVSLGKSDDYILSVFHHCAIGQQGKYAERGLGYLARTITKARDATPDPTLGTGIGVADLLALARKWVYSADCIEYLREQGIRRPADVAKVLAGVVLAAREHNALVFTPGLRKVAEYAGVSHMTAKRQLERLAAAGVIGLAVQPTGWQVSLSFVPEMARSLYVTVTDSTQDVNTVTVTYSEDWHEANLQSDLFASVPYWIGRRRRLDYGDNYTVLLQSLGPGALHVWRELLSVPEATAQELAEATGLSLYSVKRVLRKMESAALVCVVRTVGKQHTAAWALVDAADERAAIILPETTGYGTGVRNAELADRLQASWLEQKLDDAIQAQRSGDDTPELARKIAKLRQHVATIRQRADVRAAQLEAMGIKPAKHYRPAYFMRYDEKEQEAEYAEACAVWQELADLPMQERVRMMGLAGWAPADISVAMKMTQRRSPVLLTQQDAA